MKKRKTVVIISPKIMVDADACPVKAEIINTARLFQWEVWMVASYDHRLQPAAGAVTIQVDRSDQSVDLYIVNQLQQGDILVTQDFGLASIGLAKQAVVISNRGQLYSNQTIDYLLETRHEQARKRRSGKHTKGPKPLTKDDRNYFLQTLTKVFKEMKDNST